ncbi:MAG: methyltransferase [Rickettsiales bacterium]|nr:MAG: methyltransferase [Rickettsiales bacterium]
MKKFEEIEPIYTKIFQGVNGYGISLLEKEQREKNESLFKDVLYGEVPFGLLYAMFVLQPVCNYIKNAKVFYDLGSGIGNAVIGSYLTGEFEKCIGIELLDSLHKTSLEVKEKLVKIDAKAKNDVQFIHSNILDADFSNADIVLFCCPTKDEKLRNEMEKKFLNLKSGAVIMSLIHKFNNENDFELLDCKLVKVAWGETPLFTYLKQ